MIWVLLVAIWYLVGLAGSAVAIGSSEWLSWRRDWALGVNMALLGPANFVAGLVVWAMNSQETRRGS